MPLQDKNLGNISSFFEPLCYLAYQARKAGNEELERRIQICVDYLYERIGSQVSETTEE